jgi:hypothetical protein
VYWKHSSSSSLETAVAQGDQSSHPGGSKLQVVMMQVLALTTMMSLW